MLTGSEYNLVEKKYIKSFFLSVAHLTVFAQRDNSSTEFISIAKIYNLIYISIILLRWSCLTNKIIHWSEVKYLICEKAQGFFFIVHYHNDS